MRTAQQHQHLQGLTGQAQAPEQVSEDIAGVQHSTTTLMQSNVGECWHSGKLPAHTGLLLGIQKACGMWAATFGRLCQRAAAQLLVR